MIVLIVVGIVSVLSVSSEPKRAATAPPDWFIGEAFFEDEGADGWTFSRNHEKIIPRYDLECGGVVTYATSEQRRKLREALSEELASKFARFRLEAEPPHLYVAFPDRRWETQSNEALEVLAGAVGLSERQITLTFPPRE